MTTNDYKHHYYESAAGDFMIILTHDAAQKTPSSSIPDTPKQTLSLWFNSNANGKPDDYLGCFFGVDDKHPVLTDGKGRNGRFEYLELEQFKPGVYKTGELSPFFALAVYYEGGDKVQFFAKNKSKSFLVKQTLFDQTAKFEA